MHCNSKLCLPLHVYYFIAVNEKVVENWNRRKKGSVSF